MKEAAGEANMTVITIVLIAIVLGVGTIIVNRLMASTQAKSCCAEAGGYWEGGSCKNIQDESAYAACTNGTMEKPNMGGAGAGAGDGA